jgi:hypothetical protein
VKHRRAGGQASAGGDRPIRLAVETGTGQCGQVKTMVDLPDPLYKRARIQAAERGTMRRVLLIEGLREEEDV